MPMSGSSDLVPRSIETYPSAPLAAPPLDEDAGTPTLHQEINERRARIENAELLRHLRGL
jgi:hypothetical protein